jgi:hypothetical protein
MPHLALPALAAYLRAHGIEVIQRDLNVEVFDQVLSGRHLRAVRRRLRKEEKRVALKGLDAAARQANLELIAWGISVCLPGRRQPSELWHTIGINPSCLLQYIASRG